MFKPICFVLKIISWCENRYSYNGLYKKQVLVEVISC